MPRRSGACVWRLSNGNPAPSANPPRSIAPRRWTSSASAWPPRATTTYVVGAFAGGKLVGTVGFGRNTRHKERHKGRIWGVFVQEEHRGQGIARRLMDEVLRRAGIARGARANHPHGGRSAKPRPRGSMRLLDSRSSGTSAAALKIGRSASGRGSIWCTCMVIRESRSRIQGMPNGFRKILLVQKFLRGSQALAVHSNSQLLIARFRIT